MPVKFYELSIYSLFELILLNMSYLVIRFHTIQVHPMWYQKVLVFHFPLVERWKNLVAKTLTHLQTHPT
jgi:hypothetical protein